MAHTLLVCIVAVVGGEGATMLLMTLEKTGEKKGSKRRRLRYTEPLDSDGRQAITWITSSSANAFSKNLIRPLSVQDHERPVLETFSSDRRCLYLLEMDICWDYVNGIPQSLALRVAHDGPAGHSPAKRGPP
jgi:hypothetical protein